MQPILLLHGAVGSSVQLQPLADQLSGKYDVHLFSFPGHGGTEPLDEPFSIKSFAGAVLNYTERKKLNDLIVFGYSMGGYVALYLAKEHPQLFAKIITLGTKFHWDEATAAKEVKMLNPETIAAKVPAFAAALEKMHAPNDWKKLLNNTAAMLLEMGKHNPLQPEDYATITTPALLMLGDRDAMVTLEETVNTYKQLPHAQMAVLPGTPHPVEKVDAGMIAWFIENYSREDAKPGS